jgi:basic membrane protein A
VFFYISGGGTVPIGATYTESIDNSVQSGYASGYAAGLLMKDKSITKAGFIAGVNAAFNRQFYAPWAAGVKAALPSAQTTITYTGDENDSAKAVEAFNALQSQGVGLIYPYLGGSTFAVAKLANQANIPVLTPGTDNCATTSPKFAISVIFSPGDYFAAILQQFKAGTLKLGVARNWRMGADPVPTVKFCNPTGNQAQQLASLISGIGNGSVSLANVPTGS